MRQGFFIRSMIGFVAFLLLASAGAAPVAANDARVVLDENFDSVALGEQPPRMVVNGEDPSLGSSIRVTGETSASGDHSLKVVDAASGQPFWPSFQYRGFRLTSDASLRFVIKLEPGAVVEVNVRDQLVQPFKQGPQVRLDADGTLTANGYPLDVAIPTGEWIEVEIHAPLGSASPGFYSLSVRLPDGTTRSYTHLPYHETALETLTYIGFLSFGAKDAVYFLDDLTLVGE